MIFPHLFCVSEVLLNFSESALLRNLCTLRFRSCRRFMQSRMLVTDELVDRTKNCCLTPVDFLEAIVRLADAIPKTGDSWPTIEEAFEVRECRFLERTVSSWRYMAKTYVI